jgi:hypothetical protein
VFTARFVCTKVLERGTHGVAHIEVMCVLLDLYTTVFVVKNVIS